MSTLSGLGTFSYGSLTLDLLEYDAKETPQISQTSGRVSTKVEIKATCQIIGSSQADLVSQLNAAIAVLRIDAQSMVITGLTAANEYTLFAADCTLSTPCCTFETKQGPAPLTKNLIVTVDAYTLADHTGKNPGGAAPPSNSFTTKYATGTDQLVTVTVTGKMVGLNSPAYFLGTVLPGIQTNYPLPAWVIDSSYTASSDASSSSLSYSVTVRQNVGPLPAMDKENYALDGEATIKIEIDEQFRRSTTTQYDLLFAGDGKALYGNLRAMAASPPGSAQGSTPAIILKESMDLSTIAKPRLRASFTVLDSADPSKAPLMNFNQKVTLKSADPIYEIKTYPGASPVCLQKALGLPTCTQSGSATAAGQWFKPPENLYALYLDEPQTTYEQINAVECVTTWNYNMTPGSGAGTTNPLPIGQMLAAMVRSAQDQVFVGIAQQVASA
jgi:hypothetical protein